MMPFERYDIFLSFSDQDKRYTFTGTLYNALRNKRIKTFFRDDDKLLLQISPSILKAIEDSRVSIVVLSENYASSTRCLDELVKILDCMNKMGQLVWPIFYRVEPHIVRNQRGNYGEAIAALEKKSPDYAERVQKWREALSTAASLAGWSFGTGYEYELIDRIVESAVQSLPRYDVFLSFTGEDTRHSFTGFLYDALRQEGFKTFMDDEGLKGGNEISQTIIQAIEKSRLSIVVFSENYAYSSWCLDELAKIVECMKMKNQLVWPIFYKVKQLDVCNQTKSYGDAMSAHETMFGKESQKVQKWRSALSQVSGLIGWHIKENEYEHEFIEKIVKMAIDGQKNLVQTTKSLL